MGFFGGLLQLLRTVLGGSSGSDEGQQSQTQQSYGWQRPPVAAYPSQPQPPKWQQPPHKPQYAQQPPYPSQQQLPYPSQQQQHPSPPVQKPTKSYHARVEEDEQAQTNPYYLQLRSRARDEGDAMSKAFDASRVAYQSKDGAGAKQLSEEGKRHKAEMERLNKQASDWIFRELNKDSAPNEFDLHGLFVKEAISKTESVVRAAQSRGDAQIRIIVGKGLHSQGQAAKLKPAIEELMVKYQLNAQIDPQNAGVLIVQLGGRGGRGMDPNEVARRLEKDDQCALM